MRDMRTFISGPAYAQRLVRDAHDAGAEILTDAMVTAINLDNSVDVTTPGVCSGCSPAQSSWPPEPANAPAPPG